MLPKLILFVGGGLAGAMALLIVLAFWSYDLWKRS